jgi:hypothetical protein
MFIFSPKVISLGNYARDVLTHLTKNAVTLHEFTSKTVHYNNVTHKHASEDHLMGTNQDGGCL